jgi:hypothetical protein
MRRRFEMGRARRPRGTPLRRRSPRLGHRNARRRPAFEDESPVVHYEVAASVREQRQHVLAAAYAAHPERFVKGLPHPADLPRAVWINPPAKKSTAQYAPGSTIATMHEGRPDLRLVRLAELPDHRNRRDSNYHALGVSMPLIRSE